MPGKKVDKHTARSRALWAGLEGRITDLIAAEVADSWKGGGNPRDIPIIEAERELAVLKLEKHIRDMKDHFDPDARQEER